MRSTTRRTTTRTTRAPSSRSSTPRCRRERDFSFFFSSSFLPRAPSSENSEFEELDPALQEAFDAHLERLDVDADVCAFICMFADHKEHREYVQWMEAVKRAVEE